MIETCCRAEGPHRAATRWCAPALVLLLAWGPLLARPAGARVPAQTGFVRAGTIGEALTRWRPETHLYVLGDVGLGADTLQDLARWLGRTHWTVLLVADASGQTYTDINGQQRLGKDAIEYGTGQGIRKRRGFSAQVDPRTHEPDGAVLSIVLAQHALYYTSSRAQESRSLGKDQFRDGLDRWAVQAMRAGGDIVRAVEDTVTNVDTQLGASIGQEVQAAEGSLQQAAEQLALLERRTADLREACPGGLGRLEIPDAAGLQAALKSARAALDGGRAREAAQRLAPVLQRVIPAVQALAALQQRVEAVRAGLDTTGRTLTTLEEKAAALLAAHPTLSGPLVHPGIPARRQQLAAAGRALADDPERSARAVNAVWVSAQELVQAIDAYPSLGEALGTAGTRLASLERRERAAAARRELLAARQRLDEARELHARGGLGVAGRLAVAQDALATAEREIVEADISAARLQATREALTLLLAALLAAAGYALHRRRREVRDEAEALLVSWRTALDRKLEVLCGEMEERVSRFVGPASGEGRRPWAGETLRLAGQIRADVGALSILWVSAGSVLAKAAALIRPKGLAAVYNFFFPGRYRQGIALLKDEPVSFDPADGLPRLFGVERSWRDDLLGDLASYAPFRKSFAEIVGELNLRAARANGALDALEASAVEGAATLDATAEQIRQTGCRRAAITAAAAADGLFGVPAVFAAALPAAAATLERARALWPTDPVGALQGDGARARRTAVEAAQIAGLAEAARRGALAAVDAGVEALHAAAIPTGWIEAERARLSTAADRLAAEAATAPVEPAIEALAQGLAGLGDRSVRAVALARNLRTTARPEIRRVEELVQAGREELGRALGLPAERLLREAGSDPTQRLAAAAGQADAVQAAVGEGDLDAAAAALAAAVRLTAEAAAIVAASRQACAAQAAAVEARRAEAERIERLLPEHARLLAEMRETFAPSALARRAGDPTPANIPADTGASLAGNLDAARADAGLAHEKLERSGAAFRNGELLAAAGLLREVQGHQESAVRRLAEIAERRALLARTATSNRDLLATLENRVREDETAIAGDPRTMAPTVAAFAAGKRRAERAGQLVAVTPGDPLAAAAELLAAQAFLAEVHDHQAPSDRFLYAAAEKSVEAAARQLAAAGVPARRAAGDVLPGARTTEGLRALEALAAEQARVQEVLGTPHGDWHGLGAEADRIASEAARWAATLTRELDAAEAAARRADELRREQESRAVESSRQAWADSSIAETSSSGSSGAGSSSWVDSSSGSGSSSWGSSDSGSGSSGW